MAVAFPAFRLVDTGRPALVHLGVGLGIGALSIPYAPIGAVVSGMFPEAFRYVPSRCPTTSRASWPDSYRCPPPR